MLDVRRMRVLREVAQRGSFSAAAEALNFTQSAVSQQVAALERETGTKLVDRGPRGIRLTDAGEALVAHTDAILARLGDAEEQLRAIAGLRGGRLRLACFQSGGATLVPRAVAVFHARHPEVELTMVEAEPEEAVERLRGGEVDLALTFDYASAPDPVERDLETVHLVDDRYELVLPAAHPLAGRRALKLADLKEEPLILSTGRCGCQKIVTGACQAAGFQPRTAFETDENTAAQAFVAAGVGLCLLPRLALATVHPDVVIRSLRDAPVRRIWATRLASDYRSAASEAMLQILEDVAEEFGEPEPLTAVS